MLFCFPWSCCATGDRAVPPVIGRSMVQFPTPADKLNAEVKFHCVLYEWQNKSLTKLLNWTLVFHVNHLLNLINSKKKKIAKTKKSSKKHFKTRTLKSLFFLKNVLQVGIRTTLPRVPQGRGGGALPAHTCRELRRWRKEKSRQKKWAGTCPDQWNKPDLWTWTHLIHWPDPGSGSGLSGPGSTWDQLRIS